MRAVGFSSFGGPEVLGVVELPDPVPGSGEVLIRVVAAAINPTDVGMRAGGRSAALAAFPPPWVAGMDAAGVVEAIGEPLQGGAGGGVAGGGVAGGVGAGVEVGARVMAIVVPMRTGRGAQAERVVVPAGSVTAIPAASTLVEASTLPMNGLTVRRALDLLALAPGATLAVTGAAGAVGGYAVQLGKALGLRVVADAAAKDEALVLGLGADVVVPRGPEVAAAFLETTPGGVDGLIDGALIGGPVLPAVRAGGGVAAVRLFEGEAERAITVHQVAVSEYATNWAALDGLRQLADQGVVSLRVADTVTPEQAGEAQVRLAEGGVRGRLVIVF